MTSRFCWKSGGALLGAALAASLHANVIYDNGAPNGNAGPYPDTELSRHIVADDFILSRASSISSAEFWDWEFPGEWDGTVQWWIYADSGGQPGTIVASGSTTSVTKNATGNSNGDTGSEYVYRFDLSTRVLSADTKYWFGLHLATNYTGVDHAILWELTDNQKGNLPYYDDTWSQANLQNMGGGAAFNLSGSVPDGGSTGMMLGGALILLGLLRWRSRKVSELCRPDGLCRAVVKIAPRNAFHGGSAAVRPVSSRSRLARRLKVLL